MIHSSRTSQPSLVDKAQIRKTGTATTMSSAVPLTRPAPRSGLRSLSSFSRFRPPPASLSIPNSKLRQGILPAFRALPSNGPDAHGDIKEPTSQPNSPAPVDREKVPESKNPLSSIAWVVGSLFCVVIPFYKKLKVAEDIVEMLVIKVSDEIEKTAPMVKSIAEEIEKTLPKGSKLIPKLDLIEKLADDATKGAEKAEAFARKVDQIFDKVEEKIDPLIEFKEPKDNK